MSYKKQELLTLREHLSSLPVFWLRPCCPSFHLFVLSYCVSLRSEFSVVMSVAISSWKRYIGSSWPPGVCWSMTYLRCMCLLYVMSSICCVVSLFCFSCFCVPYVASFSVLSIFDYPFGNLKRLCRYNI